MVRCSPSDAPRTVRRSKLAGNAWFAFLRDAGIEASVYDVTGDGAAS